MLPKTPYLETDNYVSEGGLLVIDGRWMVSIGDNLGLKIVYNHEPNPLYKQTVSAYVSDGISNWQQACYAQIDMDLDTMNFLSKFTRLTLYGLIKAPVCE